MIVVDLLPSDTTSWPTIALKANPKPEKSGGLFACFRPEVDEPDSRDLHTAGPGHLTFLADLDTLRVYPQARSMLQRCQIQHIATALNNAAGGGGRTPFDFTMHGANKIALYRGYVGESSTSNGGANGSMQRTNSSTAVAEVASEGGNASLHSNHSLDAPNGARFPGLPGMFSQGASSEYESPVMAFSSSSSPANGRSPAASITLVS